METKAKLEECFEILTALLRTCRTSQRPLLGRAHRLLESALGDFFSDPDDAAALGQCFPEEPADEETVYIGEYPPLPRS